MADPIVSEIGQIAQWGAVGICIFVTLVFAFVIKKLIEANEKQQEANSQIIDKYRDLLSNQFQQMAEAFKTNAEVIRGNSDVVASDVAATNRNTQVLDGLVKQLIECNQ